MAENLHQADLAKAASQQGTAPAQPAGTLTSDDRLTRGLPNSTVLNLSNEFVDPSKAGVLNASNGFVGSNKMDAAVAQPSPNDAREPSKKNKSKEARCAIIAVVILVLGIVAGVVVMMSNKPPPPPPENYLIEQVSMGTVPNSTIGGEVWRHLSGNENFGVAVVNRVLSLNGASAILMHKGNDTWLLEIESGTNVSYVTPYTANSVLALRTTTDAVSLAEYSVGPDRGTKATPLSLFNLTNITSAAFRHPVREASMYLSLKNMSHVYVSLGDSSLKTWVYRLQLPSLVVDRNSTITPASLRGTYRFAESAGYADPDSDGISGILMLASEPAPLVYDAYGMLQPRNLSLLVSPRYLFPYNFMGAPSRGSMSADGATGVILGDRKLVAEDSERVTRTNESSIWSGQMFELFPKYFWEYEQTSYGGGALTDVLAHSSSFFTLRGFDDGVEVHQARDSSSKKKDTFKYSFRRTGITVESLASAGSGAFYVLGTWESEVSIKKYTFRSSS